ncbi:hypothetical protein L3X38_042950 [Prunus dulcis]|uniref:DUF4371 domain-containing protein n=1 Tax=Prunus dulcis TaxID=3755 RepID=A0AAD4UX84_PRUDU|nr:hypothetical protein L3X38_042950 [Prunus dulcis]
MKKQPKIDGFFKRKHIEVTSSVPSSTIEAVAYENRCGSPRIETTDNEVDISTLERDPGLRPQIWNYPVNQCDKIRQAYINVGPYQPILSRGQGYDCASNIRGEWNGLQALVLNDCSYAYYVHCLAHQLQLALIASSREVIHVHHFFTKLTSTINIVGASCKRNDELKNAQADEIEHMIAIDELETGKGMNQIGTLQSAGDTRWGSHLKSITSLVNIFSANAQF